MSLEGIDVFVKVIQLGSFTRAAKALNRPVTTVSDKVAQLEKRLGVTLIHRTTRQLKLTSAGEIYFKKCEQAIFDFEGAEQDLSAAKQVPQGRLRISMAVDVGHTIAPNLVSRYVAQYPNVQVELNVTNRMVDLVAEGIDLAIRVGNLKDSTFRSRKYLETTMSFFASPELIQKYGQVNTPKQLERFPYIRFFLDMGRSLEIQRGKEKANLNLKPKITADDLETIKKLVMNSEGVGLIPNYICEKEEQSGRLIRVLPEWSRGKIILSFVYPPTKFVSPNVKAFIDLALVDQYQGAPY